VIASFQRAAIGVAAVCLVAAALVAPLGLRAMDAAAAAAILSGDAACIPVKGQTPRPDFAVVGLTPSGTEVIVKNIGCGPNLNAFNVWVALTDGVVIEIDQTLIEKRIQPGESFRVHIDFDCQFVSAYVLVDREQITRDSDPSNNSGTFGSIVC
jgi:hypothetical protein